MERTELREQFFDEVKSDPYAHMILTMCADAWADGYDQALRDAAVALAAHHGSDDGPLPPELTLIVDLRHARSHGERCEAAVEWMTDRSRKAHAQAIVALAQVGNLVRLGPHGTPR